MKTRAFFLLAVSIDLDMVPGTFHQPEDFPAVLKDRLTYGMPYDPTVAVAYEGKADYRLWVTESSSSYVRPTAPKHMAEPDEGTSNEGVTAIVNRYAIKEAEYRAALRTITRMIEDEDHTQQWLAGPLLAESQDQVKKLEAAREVMLLKKP